jgi:NAD(P)-dependent dehydrogenase (short-subunit alcohol dehydrogenase family)
MNDLKEKVVLITGASSGIGAAAALAFGRWGCQVAVHFNSHEKQALDIVEQIEKSGARADECSGAMLFLASEEMSGYVIGQVIEVNGGTVMP